MATTMDWREWFSLQPKGKNMYVIVRTYSAGVFFGELDSASRSSDGKRGIIKNARRLWRWDGAATLSELSQKGTKRPDECRFPQAVPWIELTEIIEVIGCSDAAVKSISEVPVWSAT